MKNPHSCRIGFMCILMMLFMNELHSQSQKSITVFFSNENEKYPIAAVQKDGVDYVSLAEFADLLGIANYSYPLNKKTLLQSGRNNLKVTAFNPFIVLNGDLLQMSLPTLEINGKTVVPLHHFLEATKAFFPMRFSWDSQRNWLRVFKINENITGIELTDMGNGSIIRLATTKAFKPSEVSVSIDRGWLSVTLFGGVVDSAYLSTSPLSKTVKEIIPYQFDGSAYIKFKLAQDMADKKVDISENAVNISLWTSRQAGNVTSFNSAIAREKWRIDRIVIDPGHGGRDPGAIGPSKLFEKGITLEIAEKLKALLKSRLPDVTVLLTREGDTYLGLEKRPQFANANDGKLFISIHTNANVNRSFRGFTTYLLGMHRTKEALETAEKENSVLKLEESSEAYDEFQDMSYILNAIAQSSYLKESQDLAQMVNQSLSGKIKIPDKGVHQAGLRVLVGPAMPSVLVETAFISNREEERLLKTRSFRQKVAEGLCDSICEFKRQYEQEIE